MQKTVSRLLTLLGLATIIGSVASPIHATVQQPVPEIDGSSVAAGLGLLAGAVMILRTRMRRR